ncbi:single-stranded DNA-binding protein [Nocardiopsis valliformis]|uniref:single-stranded DNA-binding protein n=1 Tax=Nocardiopsis valliformis TaxID=239974 RepID=UPI0003496838
MLEPTSNPGLSTPTKNKKRGKKPNPALEPPAAKKVVERRASASYPETEAVPERARESAPVVRNSKRKGQRNITPEPASEPESGAVEQRVPGSETAKAGDSGLPMPPLTERPDRAEGHRNEVFVVGRVTSAPFEREFPSGARLVTWRICMARPEVPGRRARSDSLTLVSFDEALCAKVHGWRVGDVVRVTGELRRRIWRGWKGVQSVLEVEVDTATLVRRANR